MVAEALTLTGSIHDYPVVPECDLNVHLSKLLEMGNLSDVTLAVGDKEFKAHKAILAGKVGTLVDKRPSIENYFGSSLCPKSTPEMKPPL